MTPAQHAAPDGRTVIGEPDPGNRHTHLQPVVDVLRASGNSVWEQWSSHAHGPDTFVFWDPLDLDLLKRTFIFPDFIYVGPDKAGQPVVECSRSETLIFGQRRVPGSTTGTERGSWKRPSVWRMLRIALGRRRPDAP